MAVQLLTAALGTVGFGLIYQLRTKYIFWSALGGFLCWAVELFFMARLEGQVFFPALTSGFAVAVYAEIMARICGCPSTLFFVTSSIPLIPGRTLYLAMRKILENDMPAAIANGTDSLLIALGITAGMAAAWTICDFSRKILKKEGTGAEP